MESILEFFHPLVQVKLLEKFNEANPSKATSSKIEELKRNEYGNLSKVDTNVKSLQNLIEHLEIINNNSDKLAVTQNNIGFALSKKIIQEADLDLFLTYISKDLIYSNEERAKLLLKNLVYLIEQNVRSNNLNFYEYSSIKISCLYLLLNLDFLNQQYYSLNSTINKIKDEIDRLEAQNQVFLNQQSGLELDLSTNININRFLSNIPVLKSYLLHWYILIFYNPDNKSSSNLNEYLKNVDCYLELALNSEYFKMAKKLNYLTYYITFFFIISRKEKNKSSVIELCQSNEENLACKFLLNVFEDFSLEELLEQRMQLLEICKKDCFLNTLYNEFEIASSEMILMMYVSLYCEIDLSKLSSLKLRGIPSSSGNFQLKDYVLLLIKNMNKGCEVREENNVIEYSYSLQKMREDDGFDYLIRTRNIRNIADSIKSHLQN